MNKPIDELIETLKDIARTGGGRSKALVLAVPLDLMREIEAVAHLEGLSPEGWAVKALYKQSHADKELFVSCGCDWPAPVGAHSPDRKEAQNGAHK